MREPKKSMFVVISPGRAGSTMLVDRLATHPDVRVQMEILADSFRPNLMPSQRILKRLAPRYFERHFRFNGDNIRFLLDKLVAGGWQNRAKLNGFKLIEAQWHGLSHRQQQEILSLHDLKVVYLDRADLFSHFVSLERAAHFGFTFRREGAPPHDLPPVHLSTEKFIAFVSSRKVQKVYFRQTFSSFPHMRVEYESLVNNAEAENLRLMDFLELDYAPLQDRFIRNSDIPLGNRISNLDEFCRDLQGSPYERLLPSWRQLLTAGPC